jgi:polyisoprenyl-phosphate glycosyltransferase
VIKTLAILLPVLDDWTSFAALLRDISDEVGAAGIVVRVFAVDDGSVSPFDIDTVDLPANSCIASVEIIRLALNLGHQRAIAVGLCGLADSADFDAVLVMDSDGEDRARDIPALLAAGGDNPGAIVVAARAKRSEPLVFRMFYRLYRVIFHLLTGQSIHFGNFSLLPMAAVRRLVYAPQLWNNLAASIMRSRIPYIEVPTERGVRFAGRSRMNFVGLIVHGLSALSVHTDMIFVRVLLASIGIAVAAGFGIVVVTAIRFGASVAIPGWATTAVGDLLIIMLQTLVVIVASTLTMLAGRSNRPIVPIADAGQFIAERQRFEIGRRPRPVVTTATAATAIRSKAFR